MTAAIAPGSHFDPRRWSVRVRSTIAASLVVLISLVLAGAALLAVLYSSLSASAREAADSRARQVVEQSAAESPTDLDASLFSTDGQIGVVQILTATGALARTSVGDLRAVTDQVTAPGTTSYRGRIEISDSADYWVTTAGVAGPAGPITVVIGADRASVKKVLLIVGLLLAVVGPFVVALVAYATYRLVGAALEPVESVRSTVASLSARRLGDRVPGPDSRDEIARLAVTMNDLLDRLEAAGDDQRRFISDASHELRSPLSTITTALEIASARRELLDAALIDNALLPEARRMAALIDDLLLLARADEHRAEMVVVDVDLDDIVYAERMRVASLTSMTVVATVEPARVKGDPVALARLVRNLVDNAVRHASGTVELTCALDPEPRPGLARIVVGDDGPGIPAAQRRRVFGRFVRLDAPRTREQGGSGLGLAIVASIVAAHDGTVAVDDRPGGGTLVTVTLPQGNPDEGVRA